METDANKTARPGDWLYDMERRVADAIACAQHANERCDVTADPCGADCSCLRQVEHVIARMREGAQV